MSFGARLILTNSSLSSLPLFTMGMFLLADGLHAKVDTPRSKFFWEGAGIKRKYHLVKWATVCRPKNQGGLGILNSKLMNVALLTKWIWKLSQNASGLWVDLLKAKYFPNGNFFKATQRGSTFWNGIQAVKPAFALGAQFHVQNRKSKRLWLDSWLGSEPLWMEFQSLYELATDTDISVAGALGVTPPVIHFKRSLSPAEGISWAQLGNRFSSVPLSEAPDGVSWKFSASGQFSVKSLYSKLTQGPALDIARGLWKAGLPLKIKNFLWQMFRKRLPTSDNVAKRQGLSNGTCGSAVDANHVFFRCHLARFAWSTVREAFGQSWNPSTGADLLISLRPTVARSAGCSGDAQGLSCGRFGLLGTSSPLRSAFLFTQLTASSNAILFCSNGHLWGNGRTLSICARQWIKSGTFKSSCATRLRLVEAFLLDHF